MAIFWLVILVSEYLSSKKESKKATSLPLFQVFSPIHLCFQAKKRTEDRSKPFGVEK